MPSVTRLPAELLEDQVIATLRADRVSETKAIVEALVGAGIRCVEFTLTISDALTHVTAACEVPGAVVGVGTVLHAQEVRDSVAAGARFVVSPSVRPRVAEEATVQAVPFVLGAWTPTEVAWAIDLASSAVKIFPAEIGGPAHLKALRGPFNQTMFIPSGGVTIQNASEWLRAGAGAISIGSSVLSPEALREGDVADITTKARALVDVVRAFRNG